MSRLIQLRQRIKAIETTQKVTHAMRLISMSSHSQLKNKELALRNYQKTISFLFGRIQSLAQTAHQGLINRSAQQTSKQLLILIGSQKGLCGTFNSDLFAFFEKNFHENDWQGSDMIAVGKNAVDFISSKDMPIQSVATFSTLSVTAHMNVMRTIADIIDRENYTSVIVISNGLKSFFLQKPQKTVLLPITYTQPQQAPVHEELNDFIWEEDIASLYEAALQQYIEVNLHFQLFQSLLAEHAARFISMDNATRNAKNLLEKARLDYNKLRQAKITKELTELASTLIS